MTNEELRKTLEQHALWLAGNGGSRANLSMANLTGADLRGADLRGANLVWTNLLGADLIEADLSGAILPHGYKYASVSWTGHGERGRRLHAYATPGGVLLSCGCFSGTPVELEQWIATHGEEHAASRLRAMRIVLELLEV